MVERCLLSTTLEIAAVSMYLTVTYMCTAVDEEYVTCHITVIIVCIIFVGHIEVCVTEICTHDS